MSGWDISPEGVSAVLTDVGTELGDEDQTSGLSGHTKTLGEDIAEAAEVAASEPIATALEEFVDAYRDYLRKMTAITSSAISGCSTAVTAYMDGDTDMARESQSNAGDISDLDL
ncbi:hypothetical protein FHX37_0048 [Haloactinospora alba]|uniref:Excreted virulence factor EspC (Type VII ESX diderm) n=1 Tax=Haloactinospora alba TaxID=405555 RepID=A0A543NEB2_9ACTN|nr:DUF6507 family protein [Haloactinospora alba]TQN30187.1 hypothetical protein FHX37_0048 [Haloactinospora alba]